jgi:DHA2 family multidrug resistance protein-like MFS transporter
MAPIGGRLSDRYPVGILGGIGLALLGIGMVLLATLSPEPSIANIVWRMVLCGIRFGFFQTPNLRVDGERAVAWQRQRHCRNRA